MCDVHLVPSVDEVRVASRRLRCGECRRRILRGAEYRHVEGVSDDGSGDRWLYTAHDSCYQLSVSDVGETGCFTYRGVQLLEENRAMEIDFTPADISLSGSPLVSTLGECKQEHAAAFIILALQHFDHGWDHGVSLEEVHESSVACEGRSDLSWIRSVVPPDFGGLLACGHATMDAEGNIRLSEQAIRRMNLHVRQDR